MADDLEYNDDLDDYDEEYDPYADCRCCACGGCDCFCDGCGEYDCFGDCEEED